MLLSLLTAVVVVTSPAPRVRYEATCLYCHSEEVAESKRFTEAGWRTFLEKKRKASPLLIRAGDVAPLAAFMAQTLKLVPPRTERIVMMQPRVSIRPMELPAPPPPEPAVVPPPLVTSQTPPAVAATNPVEAAFATPTATEPTEEQLAIEREGAELLEVKCSKCHSLSRIYGRLDSLERSLYVLERMRLRTGSGITDDDQRRLEAYFRLQFATNEASASAKSP